MKSHSSSVISSTPAFLADPAQLTKTSTFPKCSSATLAASFTSSTFVTSHLIGKQSTPNALISFASSSNFSILLAVITKLAPCLANALAICLPNPLDAPLTTTTLPL